MLAKIRALSRELMRRFFGRRPDRPEWLVILAHQVWRTGKPIRQHICRFEFGVPNV